MFKRISTLFGSLLLCGTVFAHDSGVSNHVHEAQHAVLGANHYLTTLLLVATLVIGVYLLATRLLAGRKPRIGERE